jgi:tRNA threonylcarbamoyladenosine biosynthesis protein TsaE
MSATTPLRLELPGEAATLALGARLAPRLAPGMVIYLEGDLGAGKTTLVRGMLRALGHEGKVKSPTYSLVEVYAVSKLDLYHFDFYRFTDPEEWASAGFRDLFNASSVCLVEWPQKAFPLLPRADWTIRLEHTPNARRATLSTASPSTQTLLANLAP